MTTQNSNTAKAALAMSSVTAILAAIGLAKKTSAASVETSFTLDEATKQLLVAIAEANAAMLYNVEEILARMQTGGGVSGYPVANATTIRSISLTFNQINVAIPLPAMTVPDDMLIVIKADPGNAVGSIVRVADSQQNATDPINSYPLILNEFRAVRIKDASKIWVSATALPAAVIVSAEQR